MSETVGKTVFVKFFAPWCGHCQAMAEDWEKLGVDWADSDAAIIAEVDCTDEASQMICQEMGIQGFPTLKYGDPTDLDDYNGPREYEELAAFAKENLKPICSPSAIENCDDEKKKKIDELNAMSLEDLIAATTSVEEKMMQTEQELETAIEGLQSQYEQLMADFDKHMKGIRDESSYGLIRAVLATKEDEGHSEL